MSFFSTQIKMHFVAEFLKYVYFAGSFKEPKNITFKVRYTQMINHTTFFFFFLCKMGKMSENVHAEVVLTFFEHLIEQNVMETKF